MGDDLLKIDLYTRDFTPVPGLTIRTLTMTVPAYAVGDKVRVYNPKRLTVGIVAERQWSGSVWRYSLAHPETGESSYVSYGSGSGKIDWQEERWLSRYIP